MKVDVVVTTVGTQRYELFRECTRGLLDQTSAPNQIIVVVELADYPDRISNSFEPLKKHGVKVIYTRDSGLSRSRNLGLLESSSEIVAFIDDDASPERDWLERLVQPYVDASVIGVGGSILPRWSGRGRITIPDELLWIIGCSYDGLPVRKAPIRNLLGCNMSFRREILEDVGCFDERFGRKGSSLMGSEETEICLRIARRYPGTTFIYEPDAVVHHYVHPDRQTLPYIIRRAVFEGISKRYIAQDSDTSLRELHYEWEYLRHMILGGIAHSTLEEFLSNLSRLPLKIFVALAVLSGILLGGFLPQRT